MIGRRRSRRPRNSSQTSAARALRLPSTTSSLSRWRRWPNGSAASSGGSTFSSTTSGAPNGSRVGRPTGIRRSGSSTCRKGLRILRLGIETHLVTSHYLLPLLVAQPGGLLVEVTDGTADYNESPLPDFGVLRPRQAERESPCLFARPRTRALQRYGRGDHAGVAAFRNDAGQFRRHGSELARRAGRQGRRSVQGAARFRPVGIAALHRTRRRGAGRRSRPEALEQEIGEFRGARAPLRFYGCRRLAARYLALHDRGSRARQGGRPERLPLQG